VPAPRLALRRPGRERGRFPRTPGSSSGMAEAYPGACTRARLAKRVAAEARAEVT
jgi:hypothetical protein